VAASLLARPDSSVITICGCGEQGHVQLAALRDVLPLRSGFAWDRDPDRAEALAAEARRMRLSMQVADDLASATRQSDVVVTCTTAREPFLTIGHVTPGAFIAAVGADSPDKSEIDPDLMANATVVVDVLSQCMVMGDLNHAVRAGAMTAAEVHAELGEIVCGRKPGRRDPSEVVIFDSTGTAIQDVAAAAALYERAVRAGVGLQLDLGTPLIERLAS
jgi:ornithine cyclodeaminase/alanine dehydrogenase-like protein (mu-crystallin family)